MIALNVTYLCKPGKREEFVAKVAAAGIDTASRAEAENYKYDFYLPADGSDAVLLVEKWKDDGSLAFHRTTPHYARLQELKAEYLTGTVIERFECGE